MNWGYGPTPTPGYENTSAANVEYKLRVAVERDNRLNSEEKAEYDRTLAELEFGFGFFRRAHP